MICFMEGLSMMEESIVDTSDDEDDDGEVIDETVGEWMAAAARCNGSAEWSEWVWDRW